MTEPLVHRDPGDENDARPRRPESERMEAERKVRLRLLALQRQRQALDKTIADLRAELVALQREVIPA